MPLVLDWRPGPTSCCALKRCYGHIAFKHDAEGNPWQRNVVEAVLDGKDVVGRRTGDGKSLPYQLVPLIEALRVTAARRALSERRRPRARAQPNHKMAVVISLLVSLMQDQVEKLNLTMERLFTKEELVEELGLPEGASSPPSRPRPAGQLGRGLVRGQRAPRVHFGEEALPTPRVRRRRRWSPLYALARWQARAGRGRRGARRGGVGRPNLRDDYKWLGPLRRDLIDVPFMAVSAVPTTSSWIKIQLCIGIGYSRGVFETHSSIYRGDNLGSSQ